MTTITDYKEWLKQRDEAIIRQADEIAALKNAHQTAVDSWMSALSRAEQNRKILDAKIAEPRAELAAIKPDWKDNELREALADISHAIWAHWMRYLFSVCDFTDYGEPFITAGNWQRWHRQVETTYGDLTEREKDSDREQADKLLAVLRDTDKAEL